VGSLVGEELPAGGRAGERERKEEMAQVGGKKWGKEKAF
jgi:hypothetical protein